MSVQAGSKYIIEALDVSCRVSIDTEEVEVDDENNCYCNEKVLLHDGDKDDTANDLTECGKSHTHGIVECVIDGVLRSLINQYIAAGFYKKPRQLTMSLPKRFIIRPKGVVSNSDI